MICDLPFSIQLTSIYAAPSVSRAAYSKRHINNKNIKGRKTKAMERRKKQYDKKYKIPGKQGEKWSIINSVAFIVKVNTSAAVESKKFFLLSFSLEKREKTHKTIINNSSLKVHKAKRPPQTENEMERQQKGAGGRAQASQVERPAPEARLRPSPAV